LRKTVAKSVALKRGIHAAFANHPALPRREALTCLFALQAPSLSLGKALRTLADKENALNVQPIDGLDMVCILGKGLVFGGSALYALSASGEALTPNTPPPPQRWVAFESEHELFVFFSRLLDYVMTRAMSFLNSCPTYRLTSQSGGSSRPANPDLIASFALSRSRPK
jgi:hypothetical protein